MVESPHKVIEDLHEDLHEGLFNDFLVSMEKKKRLVIRGFYLHEVATPQQAGEKSCSLRSCLALDPHVTLLFHMANAFG